MAFLPLNSLEKNQAEAEGYQQGPQPALNSPNINTQDKLGNPTTPTTSSAPYYPGALETPNLELTLTNMSANVAENFVTLDSLFPVGPPVVAVPIIQASQTGVAQTSNPVVVSITASATSMYQVSLFMENTGLFAAGHTVVATLTWTGQITTHNISATMVLDGGTETVVLETFPILVKAGAPISVSFTYGGGATNDLYSYSVRIVQMP